MLYNTVQRVSWLGGLDIVNSKKWKLFIYCVIELPPAKPRSRLDEGEKLMELSDFMDITFLLH